MARVLVVDDEPIVAIGRALSRAGRAQTLQASDGETARAMLEIREPDSSSST